MSRKYLELFTDSFDESIQEKTKLENKPYIAYSTKEGRVVYTIVPDKAPVIEYPADNEIWYTTVDDQIVPTYFYADMSVDNYPAKNNSYKNGKGILQMPENIDFLLGYSYSESGSAAYIGCFGGSISSYDGSNTNTYSNLKSIILPDNITSISKCVFVNCNMLSDITISQNTTYVGNYAFRGCTSLTNITYKGTTEQWNTITKDYNWNQECPDITVHCTDGDIVIPAA